LLGSETQCSGMVLRFVEAGLLERGPAVTFRPHHREPTLLDVQVLLVVPGGVVLGGGARRCPLTSCDSDEVSKRAY
jgi:hypothetical protein